MTSYLLKEPTVIGNSEVVNTTKGTGKSRHIDDVESSDSDLSEGQLKDVKKQRAEAAEAAKAAKAAKDGKNGGKNAESSASNKSVSGGSKKDKVSVYFTLCRGRRLTCLGQR